MLLIIWESWLCLAVRVIFLWASASCCDNCCIAYHGPLLCQSLLVWALLHRAKLNTMDHLLPTVIHLPVNFLLAFILCARMCKEVGFGDTPVLSVGAGKNVQLLHTWRGPLGPIPVRHLWESGCTLINTRSVHCGLPSSGKLVWVRWWACDCDSAGLAECTVWLSCGFLAAVRGQAVLGSERSLQM